MIDRELFNYDLPNDTKVNHINIRVGDIFDTQMQTLVCPVNTYGSVSGSIAEKVMHQNPKLENIYKDICAMGKFDIGTLYLYSVPMDYKKILCFPTKKNPKNGSKIDYVIAGMRKFVDIYEKAGITSVAFPMLGCRKGGLNTGDVFPHMLEFFKDIKIPVEIWFLRPDRELEMEPLF